MAICAQAMQVRNARPGLVWHCQRGLTTSGRVWRSRQGEDGRFSTGMGENPRVRTPNLLKSLRLSGMLTSEADTEEILGELDGTEVAYIPYYDVTMLWKMPRRTRKAL